MSLSSWISLLRSRTVYMTSLLGCLIDTPTSPAKQKAESLSFICSSSRPAHLIHDTTAHLPDWKPALPSPHYPTSKSKHCQVHQFIFERHLKSATSFHLYFQCPGPSHHLFFCLNYCNSLLTGLTGSIFAPLKFILSEVNYSLLTVLSVPWGRKKKSPEWSSHTFITVSKLYCSLQIPAWPGPATSIYVTILVPTRRLQPQSPLCFQNILTSWPLYLLFPLPLSPDLPPSLLSLHVSA